MPAVAAGGPGRPADPEKPEKQDKRGNQDKGGKQDSWAARALAEPRFGVATLIGALVGLPGAGYLEALRRLVTGHYSTGTLVVAVIVFVFIELLLIIIPFAFLALRPEGTKGALRRTQNWLRGHAIAVMAGVALVLGAYLTVSGAILLA